MLNRLPKHPGSMAEILADIGNPTAAEIAKALGVSRRTADRWKTEKAPKIARLSLWWLSREGHSVWDCEMSARTQLAIATNESLWREVTRLRSELAKRARTNESEPRAIDHANDQPAYG